MFLHARHSTKSGFCSIDNLYRRGFWREAYVVHQVPLQAGHAAFPLHALEPAKSPESLGGIHARAGGVRLPLRVDVDGGVDESIQVLEKSIWIRAVLHVQSHLVQRVVNPCHAIKDTQ